MKINQKNHVKRLYMETVGEWLIEARIQNIGTLSFNGSNTTRDKEKGRKTPKVRSKALIDNE